MGDIGDLVYMFKRPQVFLKPYSFIELLTTFSESDTSLDIGFYYSKQNRSPQGVYIVV